MHYIKVKISHAYKITVRQSLFRYVRSLQLYSLVWIYNYVEDAWTSGGGKACIFLLEFDNIYYM